MTAQSVITARTRRNAAWLLAALVVFTAIVNVPWALTRMRSRLEENKTQLILVVHEQGEFGWPSRTPHALPWPRPDYQEVRGNFGCRIYNVRAHEGGSLEERAHEKPEHVGDDNFTMQVQHLGWPLPVVEQKQMWWNWNDPKLMGPESDPALFILWRGSIFNPLLVGGGAWLIIMMLVVAPMIFIRWRRGRDHRCMDCGYPIGTSEVCTECGAAVQPRRGNGNVATG